MQLLAAQLHARHHERRVVDLHRNAYPRLDEIAVAVATKVSPEVGENSRMSDLHAFVVPVAVAVDTQIGQLPVIWNWGRERLTPQAPTPIALAHPSLSLIIRRRRSRASPPALW